MDTRDKKFVLVGGALIGSHAADRLAKADVKEIVIDDNFTRGRAENLAGVL
jgi:UDP-glucose 4-epimerase